MALVIRLANARGAVALCFALLALPLIGGSIEGRVTNSVTGEPVGGAKVRFLDLKNNGYETVTDSAGSYRLAGLADGDYRGPFASKDGFTDDSRKVFNAPFHVAGDIAVPMNAQLNPRSSLRGRVVDEDGKPAAGVRVEKDPTPPGIIDGDAVTDANGEFAFQELPPGSYLLAAKPVAKIRMQDGVRLGTVAIYYPSATEPAQAVRVPVRTGENVSGIEIRLKSVPVHRIAGMVLGLDGKPVAHATVKLIGHAGTARRTLIFVPSIIIGANGAASFGGRGGNANSGVVGPGPEPELARVESLDDGTFEFSAVEDGDWRLSAEAGVYEKVPLGGVVSAPVSGKDVEDIRIRMATLFAVEVTGDWGSAGAPPGGGRPRLNLNAVEGQPTTSVDDPEINKARVNKIFPGRYRVMQGYGFESDPYVAAVMWGGRDVNGQVVDLATGAGPFRVVFKPGAGKVSGTVANGEGSIVYLVSNGSGEILTYQQVKSGAGGAFEFDRVAPGGYYVVAFDQAEGRELPPADLPASIVPLASSVQVETGSTASVELRARKWPW